MRVPSDFQVDVDLLEGQVEVGCQPLCQMDG